MIQNSENLIINDEMSNYAHKVFLYLADHYGVSKYFQGFPCLNIDYAENDLMGGEFRDDCCEIMLNLATLEGIPQDAHKEYIATTLTHEYIHYLQSPRWMTRYYNMGYGYFDHPYEVEAYRRENELLTELLEL